MENHVEKPHPYHCHHHRRYSGVGHVYGGHDDGYQSSEFPDPWQRV